MNDLSVGRLLNDVRQLISAARHAVVNSVNQAMVRTYWEIGRRIFEEEQQGKQRADYGKGLIQALSQELTKEFGKGFSTTNLANMRLFYTSFPIFQTVSGKLSWSHYMALLRVDNERARNFYLRECEAAQWSVRQLERQIRSSYFERLLASAHQEIVRAEADASNQEMLMRPQDVIKDPYILEFLDMKENKDYLERDLETALLDKLSDFLLELGRGFAFVARQQRITTESGQHFYIDLVFYNFMLRCFVLIDLKRGQLTHQDIGQMDMYVRMYDEMKRQPDDAPTIGLILCADNDKTVMRYSSLNGSTQLFASKYKFLLPTEEEIRHLLSERSDIPTDRTSNQEI